ncbi:MAG: hypothetical protein AABY83_04885 [Pseudomonadota bacterium]
MSLSKPKKPALALAALAIGVIALPVAGLVSWVLGLVLLGLPVFLIYAAS